jgi:hypothetical protein
MTVDLRPIAGRPGLFAVWGSGVDLGSVHMTVTGSGARILAQLDRAPAHPEDLGDFLMATMARARAEGATEIAFSSPSLLLRDAARRAGLRGPVRVPLVADIDAVAWPTPGDGRAPVPNRQERQAWLVFALGQMGVAATAPRPAGAVGRLARRLASGVGDTLEVVISWAPGQTFVISAPDRYDLMPEPLALTADTAAAVLRRFPHQAAAVTLVSFDQALYGLKEGLYAGVAVGSVPAIHLMIGFVTVEAFLQTLPQNDEPLRLSSTAQVPPPFTPVDAVVAHELWHRIESVFEANHYRSSIEFRRQLGLHLGVATLEHAVKGAEATAPPPWRTAHRRLVDEVSAYAGTAQKEATAEMFKLWWCRTGPVSRVVARFGELVDQFFPISGGRPGSAADPDRA